MPFVNVKLVWLTDYHNDRIFRIPEMHAGEE